MAISVGPGIGIMLAYLVDSDPAYYEAVMKSIGLQFFGVIIVNIVERVSLRASSETRCNSLAFQFYFVIDLIQAIMYIETEALGFSFLKVAMVQQVGSLFLHSGLKEVLLWILGIAYNDKIPLVDKTQLQVKKVRKGGGVRNDSSIPPTAITNNLPLVASLLTADRRCLR